MDNKKEWAFSARVQLHAKDQKQYLEFQLFTDTNSYKFGNMCNFIETCNLANDVITDTDDGLTSEEKEKIKYCAQDFDNDNLLPSFQNVVKKYWNKIHPTENFQIYIGNDFDAVQNITLFFYKIMEHKNNLDKQKNNEIKEK